MKALYVELRDIVRCEIVWNKAIVYPDDTPNKKLVDQAAFMWDSWWNTGELAFRLLYSKDQLKYTIKILEGISDPPLNVSNGPTNSDYTMDKIV